MNLLIVGINHHSAPVALREQIAFTPEQMPDALEDLVSRTDIAEVAILSTCNRTEVIATCPEREPGRVIEWLAEYHQMPVEELSPSVYHLLNRDAALHAVRVACGLDSMVVGEAQILGQFKDCFEYARQNGTLGTELQHLSQTAFRIAKKVRTDTAIGENSVSVASTAVTLANQLFSDLGTLKTLIIGAGDTSELVGKHLTSAGIRNITIANRTLERAKMLARQFDGEAIDLQSIPHKLAESDLVIAATASQLPVLGKGTVERALKERKHRPIMMVDLAVPRDIEPEVRELRDVYLYSVDDLQQIVNENLESRQAAADAAEAIVNSEVAAYRTRKETRAADATLVKFRAQHDLIKQQELEKALARLERGDDPADALNQLANQLTNKIIHTPSTHLKDAALNGDQEFLDAISKLYQLDDDNE